MTLTRALIVPSMFAGPDDHWYPDLRRRLVAKGFVDIRTAELPPGEPVLSQWLAAMDGCPVDGGTLIVGHSLGAVAALARVNAVEEVGAFVGVAGFSSPLPDAEFTRDFCAAVDLRRLQAVIRRRHVLVAMDDYGVPPAMTEQWALDLGADLHRVEVGGHFLARDGWTASGIIGDVATG